MDLSNDFLEKLKAELELKLKKINAIIEDSEKESYKDFKETDAYKEELASGSIVENMSAISFALTIEISVLEKLITSESPLFSEYYDVEGKYVKKSDILNTYENMVKNKK